MEVILQIREKANKNDVNDDIGLDLPRVVNAFNIAQDKFLNYIIKNRQNDLSRRHIEYFLEPEVLLKKSTKKDKVSEYFVLPENYFDMDLLRCEGVRGDCIIPFYVWELKSPNFNEVYYDNNNKPSFVFAETFYHLSGGRLRVFVDGFSVKPYLTYYRLPKRLDIAGYIGANGNQSVNSDPEWRDRELDKVINLTVKELIGNAGDYNKAQMNKLEVIQEI